MLDQIDIFRKAAIGDEQLVEQERSEGALADLEESDGLALHLKAGLTRREFPDPKKTPIRQRNLIRASPQPRPARQQKGRSEPIDKSVGRTA
jgi:hypothetical protein